MPLLTGAPTLDFNRPQMNKKEAKEIYDKLANSDFSKMSVEQIKLNITQRCKFLNIYLNPKIK